MECTVMHGMEDEIEVVIRKVGGRKKINKGEGGRRKQCIMGWDTRRNGMVRKKRHKEEVKLKEEEMMSNRKEGRNWRGII